MFFIVDLDLANIKWILYLYNMKSIEGFSEYKITSDGKVISHRWPNKPRELKPGKMGKGGYLSVALMIDNIKAQSFRVHRLVAKHYVSGYFEGAVVNHIDENKLNNHYSNLEWVTQEENVAKYFTK